MLSIGNFGNSFGRRDFLRVGGLGLGGLTLADLLRTKSSAASGGEPTTGKSVIFLFMHGGPSQVETFDPKMDRPSEIRSCLLYTSPSPRDLWISRMPSSA